MLSQNDVSMSWLRLTETASPIHIRHIQRVWAHWYAVHRHMVAAIHSYTHPSWLRCWDSGSLADFLFVGLMTGGFSLMASCQLMPLQQNTLESDVLYLEGHLYPIQLWGSQMTFSSCNQYLFLLRWRLLYVFFFDGSWLLLRTSYWVALTSLSWVLGTLQTLSGESLFVLWELVMWNTPWGDGTTGCPA